MCHCVPFNAANCFHGAANALSARGVETPPYLPSRLAQHSCSAVGINVEVSVPAVSTARRTPEEVGALPHFSSDLAQRFRQCCGDEC